MDALSRRPADVQARRRRSDALRQSSWRLDLGASLSLKPTGRGGASRRGRGGGGGGGDEPRGAVVVARS
ncbi:hypothetical protein DAI22_10g014400 [Oryza sativa Japonica Group]|nr:hypothetical protein DAI22_10g014400 [Oryza sativa Japonica Group]